MRVDLTQARMLAATQDGVVFAAQLARCGLTFSDVRTLTRRSDWERLAPQAYLVDAPMYDDVPPVRTLARAFARPGSGLIVVAETAGFLHGLQGLGDYAGVITLAIDPRRPRPATGDTVVHQWRVKREDVCSIDGIPVTSAIRTVSDLLLNLDRPAALSVLDSALHLGVLQDEDKAELDLRCRHRPGAVAARGLIPLGDKRAASPLESRVRLACVDGGLAPDELQWPVLSRSGALLGYGDIAWLKRPRPLIGEADGAGVHSLPAALLHDRRRANGFVAAGCDIVRFTWADALRPPIVRAAVRAALAA